MIVFKCKMCGGDLEVNEKVLIGTCQHCGSTMTLPRLDNEKRANLYDRANHYRRNSEYDKAMGVYETILNEDKIDAEAYWSVILCKFGIEYVEDPKTHKRVPTCNRTQMTSIFSDADYKAAIEYADGSARAIYEAEAKAIDELQKGIHSIISKEEPFDIFLSYKETDNNGRRTPDSVLAQEIYYHLTKEGYKVFFSKITLENILGSAYEPYIFAALNSAKVMIVIGTKIEYINSVWVKNEWSRYLGYTKYNHEKILIPAYKDINPYDLPEEFSHLQAQDMGKLGFIQDLTRGIDKIFKSKEKIAVKETVMLNYDKNIAPLLKRAFILLEDGDFDKADDLLEQVLNQDPELPHAYVGKLMIRLVICKVSELSNGNTPLDVYDEYNKALRYSKNSEYEKTLFGYNQIIKDRIEYNRQDKIYFEAKQIFLIATANNDESLFIQAEALFKSIEGFKDSTEMINLCKSNANDARVELVRKKEKEEQKAVEVKLEKERKIIENRKKAIRNRPRNIIITSLVVVTLICFGVYRDNISKEEAKKAIEEAIKEKEETRIELEKRNSIMEYWNGTYVGNISNLNNIVLGIQVDGEATLTKNYIYQGSDKVYSRLEICFFDFDNLTLTCGGEYTLNQLGVRLWDSNTQMYYYYTKK